MKLVSLSLSHEIESGPTAGDSPPPPASPSSLPIISQNADDQNITFLRPPIRSRLTVEGERA